jgi:hypothetical protein
MSTFDQDFKYAWMWILVEKIFEAIIQDKGICTKTPKLEELARIIGYDVGSGHSVLMKQHLSIMPKIASGKVEISAKSPVIEGKIDVEFKNKEKALIPFGELVRAAVSGLCKLSYTGKSLYLFVDELEAFSTSKENFDRDVRMIRDLLVAVYDLNSEFRTAGIPIYLIAAVRSEMMAAVNRTGQEVGRTVEDFSFTVDWSHGARGPQHPLIQLIRQKIKASEIDAYGRQKNMDPMATYFDSVVDSSQTANYLLDATMYRPRDLVRRLGLVKKRNPTAFKFTADTLKSTFGVYSDQTWQEVAEELVPGYLPEEVVDLEHALRGFPRYFYRRKFDESLREAAPNRPALRSLLFRYSAEAILRDLFRLGAVGNHYKIGDANNSRIVQGWAFRGTQTLDVERRMVFHRALWPHLALIDDAPRARGVAAKQNARASNRR